MGALGYVVLVSLIVLIVFSLLMVLLIGVSMRRGKFYLPRLMKPSLIVLEGLMMTLWRVARIDDRELIGFSIRLRNQMNIGPFSKVPMDRRLVFLPQCLRSSQCPSHLSTEGLVCQRCGRCDIGRSIDQLEKEGCRVFIVPGSTFVKRLIKKYRPEAIIGVGCLIEIKEGLEMADRMDLVAMGVVTSKDGCVETVLDWDSLFEVVKLRSDRVPDGGM